jgi:hypothetical protein
MHYFQVGDIHSKQSRTLGSSSFLANCVRSAVLWNEPVPGRDFRPAVDQCLITAHGTVQLASTNPNGRSLAPTKTWDHFLMPMLFARTVILFAPPIYVPADADQEMLEAKACGYAAGTGARARYCQSLVFATKRRAPGASNKFLCMSGRAAA